MLARSAKKNYRHFVIIPADCGLALGSYLSQWCGTLYLDGLDHFVKRQLRMPGYLRYMDDFVLFSNDRVQLLTARSRIATWLATSGSCI